MTTTDEKYQGWSNRETWAFMLHVNNDQGLQEDALTWAAEAMADRDEDGRGPTDYVIGSAIVDRFHDLIFNWDDEYGAGSLPSGLASFRDEVGSWWRLMYEEIGMTFREDAAELEES